MPELAPTDQATIAKWESGETSLRVSDLQLLAELYGTTPDTLLPKPSEVRKLTHFDAEGRAVMVDVGGKAITDRAATARARVVMQPETLAMIRAGTAKKGDVLGVARLAGIMAAKRTADLIPLCHPLPLDGVDVHLSRVEDGVRIVATARCTGRTGVEMEALVAVTTAALTVYDMLKAVDRSMRIEGVRLLEKTGGRSGHWTAP